MTLEVTVSVRLSEYSTGHQQKKQYKKIKVCELWCLKDLPIHHNLYIGSQDTHECTVNIDQWQRTCLECAGK